MKYRYSVYPRSRSQMHRFTVHIWYDLNNKLIAEVSVGDQRSEVRIWVRPNGDYASDCAAIAIDADIAMFVAHRALKMIAEGSSATAREILQQAMFEQQGTADRIAVAPSESGCR